MDDFGPVTTLFFAGLGIMLGWLIIDGLRHGRVWVRGAQRASSPNPRDWATPVAKSANPAGYWLAIGFYSAALFFVVGSLIIFS